MNNTIEQNPEKSFKAYVDESIDYVINFKTRYQVLKSMNECNIPGHPKYILPYAAQKMVDENTQQAAFVICEQIDTDRMSSDTVDMLIDGYKNAGIPSTQIEEMIPSDVKQHGFLGDQFRYTLWHIDGHIDMKRMYEDHSYIRHAINKFTGSLGRDAGIEIKSLIKDGVIAKISDLTSRDTFAQRHVEITLDEGIKYMK
jgi:hypothetical protein